MTGPIHAINWLKIVPANVTGAELALNRSMSAAAYDIFNVRNEVDVHSTTVGGHNNNTHFLTGDGGFIQTLVYGFAGLMIANENGVQLNRPVFPEGTDTIKIFGFRFLGNEINFETKILF